MADIGQKIGPAVPNFSPNGLDFGTNGSIIEVGLSLKQSAEPPFGRIPHLQSVTEGRAANLGTNNGD